MEGDTLFPLGQRDNKRELDVEIYWTCMPEWLQPRILLNITHIIPVNGRFFTGIPCWNTFTAVDSTESQSQLCNENTASYITVSYICFTIIRLSWELSRS